MDGGLAGDVGLKPGQWGWGEEDEDGKVRLRQGGVPSEEEQAEWVDKAEWSPELASLLKDALVTGTAVPSEDGEGEEQA